MTDEELVINARCGPVQERPECMLQLYERCGSIIKKYAAMLTKWAEFEDLTQEGYICICNAVNAYRADSGAPFMACAAFWVKAGLIRYVQTTSGGLRFSAGQLQAVREYQREAEAFRAQFGRDPSEPELCALLQLPAEQLRKLQRAAEAQRLRSLDEILPGIDGVTLAETIADPADMAADLVEREHAAALSAALWAAVADLPEEQAAVIKGTYKDGQTVNQAAAAAGLPSWRGYDLQKKGLQQLRTRGKYREILLPFLDDGLYSAAVRGSSVTHFRYTLTSSTEREALWEYDHGRNI